MKNSEIFQRNPSTAKLLNDGVAAVSEGASQKEIDTLRYELEHFVCEGQYKEGMIRILESFIGNVGSPVQPAAWVSGFFGSGKSHLLKMLRHLWVDTRFSDGATARGLVSLPQEVADLFKELSTVGKRHGGLHAASGTLPSGGGASVRLTVLGIVLKSRDLPESLPQARFCIWLKKNGFYESVKKSVEDAGKDFLRELQDLYVSPLLAKALLAADPAFATDEKQVRPTLRAQYPGVNDITTAEFIQTIREALSTDGQIPCTIIVLDEVQLYIGGEEMRSTDVQEVAEALCKQTDSRVLLIGAGQTALAGSMPLLQRLRGRFTIPVELSDLDVETVTRRVVLAKKADKIKEVQDCLASHAGEIDRQLASSTIASRAEDRAIIAEDYPLLPVRRRFWEHALRAADVPGTTAQLRTQLRIVHDAVREIADKPLGTVVPADYIFEQLQPDLLRTGILLRGLDETIRKFDDGSADGKLKRRLCGLIFLIRKLPRTQGVDIGVRATAEMLADLLVSDLGSDGAIFRRDVPRILQKLVDDGKLIKLDEEYSLQTRDSSEWEREFRNRQARLNGDATAISGKRASLFAAALDKSVGGIKLLHGKSKEPRKLVLHYGDLPPVAKGHEIPVWIRDGWGDSEASVLNQARAAGADSPIVFVFTPKASPEDLKKIIVDCEAVKSTLDFKGVPNTDEGREAQNAMKARLQETEARRDDLVRQIVNGSKVFQGGGTEAFGVELCDKVRDAADASLDRLFPNFREADHDRWNGVITQAKNGDAAALKVVGFNDMPEKHPVCAAILSTVGSGKKGKEVRTIFEESPYGWSRDAVDAGLILLHTAGHLRAVHNGENLSVGKLDQAKVSVTEFRVESVNIDAAQKIKLRKLFQTAEIQCRPGEELVKAEQFLAKLFETANLAGGEAPLPERPPLAQIEALKGLAGNELLSAILTQYDALSKDLKEWSGRAELMARRLPAWRNLERLLAHGVPGAEIEDLRKQTAAICADRRLLYGTDPVPPVHKEAVKLLREAVNQALSGYDVVFKKQMQLLEANDNWKKLKAAQHKEILAGAGIAVAPKLDMGDDEALLSCLEACPLDSWKVKTTALPQQFIQALLAATKLLEPKAQHVHLVSATLKTPEDVKAWLAEKEKELLAHIKKGPVVIS